MNFRPKIAVIGKSEVAKDICLLLATRDTADLIVIDDDDAAACARAGALAGAAAMIGGARVVQGGSDFGLAAGSQVVVLANGICSSEARNPKDLLKRNSESIVETCRPVMERCPNSVVLVATEPLPEICEVVARTTQFPRPKIIGASGLVEAARIAAALAAHLRVPARQVDVIVVGGREAEAVTLETKITVAGVPAVDLVDRDALDGIVAAAAPGPSPSIGVAAAVARIADAIFRDSGAVLSCHALLAGEYGINGLFMGVPVRVGGLGIQSVVEVELSFAERAAFESAAATTRERLDGLAPL